MWRLIRVIYWGGWLDGLDDWIWEHTAEGREYRRQHSGEGGRHDDHGAS